MSKDLVKSTQVVASATLLSRIMGFLRDMIVARAFGTSASLDGFFVAFRIPNLFRRLVAEGCLTISFIPVYTDYLINHGQKESLQLAQKTLNLLVIVLMLLVTLGMVFSKELVSLFAMGFKNPAVFDLTVNLTMIMFPYLFFVGLVAFTMGVLNSHKFFFSAAFSPVLLNFGFIIGALFFRHLFTQPLYGLALGVVLGGVLQVVLQIPYMHKTGFRMKLDFNFNHTGLRKIIRMMGPAVFGVAVYQINILVNTMMASTLKEGSISYLYYSDRITEMILGIFVVSLANVLMPEMSARVVKGDTDGLKRIYLTSIRIVLFLTIPATVAFMIVGYPIVTVLFMRGAFSTVSAAMTAKALFYSCIGLSAIGVLRITTPTFYSMKDSKTPVYTAWLAFFINISAGYLLMHTSLQHAGLALANVISVTVQLLVLLIVLGKRIEGLSFKNILLPIAKYSIASLFMGVAIYFIGKQINWSFAPFSTRFGMLMVIVFAGMTIYAFICWLLKVEEIEYFKKLAVSVRNKISR